MTPVRRHNHVAVRLNRRGIDCAEGPVSKINKKTMGINEIFQGITQIASQQFQFISVHSVSQHERTEFELSCARTSGGISSPEKRNLQWVITSNG